MRNHIKIFLTISTIFLIALGSCKKSFLEVDPKGKVIAKATGDYYLLLNNSSYYTSGEFNHIVMGDEIVAHETYYSMTATTPSTYAFQYADDIYLPTSNPVEATALLKMLYTYNKIINEVMTSEGGTEQQKLAIKAEALTNRAWIYMLLINYYGKPYAASTAANDPGFYIITTSDVTVNEFKRSSVQEVYDFMINDLTTAIPSLSKSLGSRMRVSKSAAEALLGKVYWFMGKYPEALVQFNSAFTNMPTDFTMSFYDYKKYLAPGGAWGYNAISSPDSYVTGPDDEPKNQEVLFYKSILCRYAYFQNHFLLSTNTMDLFKTTGNSDERLKLYSDRFNGGSPIGIPGLRRKAGFPYIQIGITLPDLYLMRAECKARTSDVIGAKADVEALRKNRMSEADALVTITDPVEMIKYIIDERVREFALQGHRWFDMRRLSTDPIFADKVYVHEVLSKEGTVVASYPLNSDRLTMRIPDKIIDMNPEM